MAIITDPNEKPMHPKSPINPIMADIPGITKVPAPEAAVKAARDAKRMPTCVRLSVLQAQQQFLLQHNEEAPRNHGFFELAKGVTGFRFERAVTVTPDGKDLKLIAVPALTLVGCAMTMDVIDKPEGFDELIEQVPLPEIKERRI